MRSLPLRLSEEIKVEIEREGLLLNHNRFIPSYTDRRTGFSIHFQ